MAFVVLVAEVVVSVDLAVVVELVLVVDLVVVPEAVDLVVTPVAGAYIFSCSDAIDDANFSSAAASSLSGQPKMVRGWTWAIGQRTCVSAGDGGG